MREIVVVTGASGCLGHATVRLLISRDSERVAEIRCLDWRAPSELQLKAIELDLKGRQVRVRHFRGDIRDINLVEEVLAGAHCVIHCAARVDVWTECSEQRADELESVNVQGTENLLRACLRLGVGKFVHVSSYEVFVSYHTIYYATEATIPEPNYLLFGPSATSKRQAEAKVRQYASQKLQQQTTRRHDDDNNKSDALNAVIIRFTPIYGEHDRHYVSQLLKLIKFFNGQLQRFTNIWIRQQPIYVGNAAWALIKAKQRMDLDESISGEEFHITDDTPIGDPFDFIEPFAESRNMKVTTSTFPAWPVWLMIVLFTFMRNSLASLDIFGLFTKRKTRLDQAIERDNNKQNTTTGLSSATDELAQFANLIRDEQVCDSTVHDEHQDWKKGKKRWYHLVTAQIFYFMCNSLFLNRTKASLRLDYEPIFDHKQSMERSLDWYKNHLTL